MSKKSDTVTPAVRKTQSHDPFSADFAEHTPEVVQAIIAAELAVERPTTTERTFVSAEAAVTPETPKVKLSADERIAKAEAQLAERKVRWAAEAAAKAERAAAKAAKPKALGYAVDPDADLPMPTAGNGSVQIYGAGYLPVPAARVRAMRILAACDAADWEASAKTA